MEKITDAAEKGRVKFLISTFSLAEIAKVPGLHGDSGKDSRLSEKDLELTSAYFENDYIIIKPLSIPIAEMAREYVCKFGLKPGDAVHVATAIYWEIPVLHSYDEKLCKRTGKIGNPPLVIENPTWSDGMPLFEAIVEPLALPEAPQEAIEIENQNAQDDGRESNKENLSEGAVPEPPITGQDDKVKVEDLEQNKTNEVEDHDTQGNGKEPSEEEQGKIKPASDGADGIPKLPAVNQDASVSAEGGDQTATEAPPPS